MYLIKNWSFFSIFLLVYFSALISSAAVNTNVKLVWTGSVSVLTEQNVVLNRLGFQGAIYQNSTGYNPSFTVSVLNLLSGSFRISDEVYEPLSQQEVALVNESTLGSNILVSYSQSNQNGQPLSKVQILALRKNSSTGQVEKLVSFSYSFDQQRNTSQLRTASASTFGALNSVLSSGDWYKIAVNADGIYKMDYNFIKSLGIDPANINPKNFRLYGNGGGMLPQPNASARIDDLKQFAIKVVGEEDNSFDPSDYILFYGQSQDKWVLNTTGQVAVYNHFKNVYADLTYYFLTVYDSVGIRIQDGTSLSNGVTTTNVFDDRYFHELDLINVLHSGRQWFGELFDYQPSQTFSFPVNNFDPNGKITIRASTLTKASILTNSLNSFGIAINGTNIGTVDGKGSLANQYSYVGINNIKQFTQNISNLALTNSLSVGVTYNNSLSPGVSGYLDYVEVNVSRPLNYQNKQQSFRHINSRSASSVQYNISSTSGNLNVWDVTNQFQPVNQLLINSSGIISFGAYTNSIVHEYFMFNGNDFLTPTFVKKVVNQNLHSLAAPYLPDLVIVTDASTLDAANRLASFRESNDGLDVTVVTTEQVYNEFNSGAQDVSALRDFMRLLYKRGTSQDSIRYLCIFGAASFDYKGISYPGSNLVPVYESYNSLHTLWSFSSEDYFGLLDDNEGAWSDTASTIVDEASDIGIGRLPIRNVTDANAIVDKIINYHTSRSSLGNWRNKATFLIDAGEQNSFAMDANSSADKLKTNVSNLNINKIFVDEYPWVTLPDGVSSPTCANAVSTAFQEGTFIFNYTGHGNETQLSGYNAFNKSMINGFTNITMLPFCIFATCDFGRYDDPNIFSGAETLVLSAQGGGIGTFNSTRPVYQNTNTIINNKILDNLFNKTNGVYPRLGDVYKRAKNQSLYGLYNRNYAMLGDPSMQLEYPSQNIVVNQFNGVVTGSTVADTLKALSKVTFSGQILDNNNQVNTNFNGELNVLIYDKENTVYTLGQLGAASSNGPFPYLIRNNIIYNGLASVSAGGFNFTFIIPKDISYLYGPGKISLYASEGQGQLDAAGSNNQYIIGGSNPHPRIDVTPPSIRLYMNDLSFVNGGFTNISPLFIARIVDSSGVNVSNSSIGHQITGVLASNISNTIVMNDYYKTDLNTFTSGGVNYQFSNLAQGHNAITFKAWDTYNNSAESYLEFIVANNSEVAIKNLLNYPNPFTTHTTFHFDHNKQGDDLELTVQIFTISGHLVKTLTGYSSASPSHVSSVSWNGHDDFGSEIGKGVYVYKLTVRSISDGSEAHQYEKLVILN